MCVGESGYRVGAPTRHQSMRFSLGLCVSACVYVFPLGSMYFSLGLRISAWVFVFPLGAMCFTLALGLRRTSTRSHKYEHAIMSVGRERVPRWDAHETPVFYGSKGYMTDIGPWRVGLWT